MPRKGPARPVTPAWQKRVRSRIDSMIKNGDIKNDAAFAKLAKISKSTLTETLQEGVVQTTVMVEIHKALGWPAPLDAPPNHILELVHALERLGDVDQGRIVEGLKRDIADAKRGRG